jgi:aspartyl-tRNA(Asn)/glutamyl-tRNA(Gln) amidotransferase subunit C
MSLTREEVEKIAHLARIALNEDNISSYTHNLSNILTLVAQMNSVDTTDVIPLAHPLDMTARLRPDIVTEVDKRDHFQTIAPQVEAGLYLVPKVIE